MDKLSLKSKLLYRLKSAYPHWIHSGTIEEWGISEGYKASHADRRMRDLVKDGKVERRRNGRCEEYRAKIIPLFPSY